jgi:O6-methylguanine-DNA--protein-cysteine methyltransferase
MGIRTEPLTHSQALYVIDRLVADRKISAAQVAKIRDAMAAEIRELEARLSRLRGAASERSRPALARARTPGRGGQLSAATQASRRLQGQYLNLIRRIPAGQRARYKQIAQNQGREEAVRVLRKVLKAR